MVPNESSGCCISHNTRASFSKLIPFSVAVLCACVGNVVIPGFYSSIPTWIALLTLWLIASIPPTSYFAAQISALFLGYCSRGVLGVFMVGILSIFGSAAMIVSNVLLFNSKSFYSSSYQMLMSVSKLFRLVSSLTMATVWSFPAPLTLVPRLIFLLYFEITVLSTYKLLNSMGRRVCDLSSSGGEEETTTSVECNSLPIVLVHGLGGGKAQWLLGKLLLQSKSEILSPITSFSYSSTETEGIDEVAKMLADRIVQLKQESGSRRVALIGHSVGGLICSHFAEYYASGCGVEVRLVVCIGTPWTGISDFAVPRWMQVKFIMQWIVRAINTNASKPDLLNRKQEMLLCAGGKMGRRMREDLHGGSDILKQLQERQLQSTSQSTSQRSTRYYNLAGTLDLLVLPSKHITSKKAFWSCWLPHVGHYSILMSETLWDQVPHKHPDTLTRIRAPTQAPGHTDLDKKTSFLARVHGAS
jgi:pimeloyl-ACP methyl ester carboxylesterase